MGIPQSGSMKESRILADVQQRVRVSRAQV